MNSEFGIHTYEFDFSRLEFNLIKLPKNVIEMDEKAPERINYWVMRTIDMKKEKKIVHVNLNCVVQWQRWQRKQ